MLDDIIVIGVVVAIVQVLKLFVFKNLDWSDTKYSVVSALAVLVLAGLAQIANAFVFDPSVPMLEALKQGLQLGATAGGIYSMGKVFIEAATKS